MSEVPMPALVLDGLMVRHNVQRLATYAASVDVKVWLHTMTHKQRYLSGMQLAAVATGLTVAKVSEAEAITDPEQDVLIAYPPVGEWRADRITKLIDLTA